jgi:hypothetical protein
MATQTLTGRVFVVTSGHYGYSSRYGIIDHPDMTIAAKTDDNGNYSVDLPSPHTDCNLGYNDRQLYRVVVPENAENRTMSGSAAIDWTNADAPAANVTVERMVKIYIKVYGHAAVPDGAAPNWIADHRDEIAGELPPNLLPDRSTYSLYDTNRKLSSLGYNSNSWKYDKDDGGMYIYLSPADMSAATGNGADPLRLEFRSSGWSRTAQRAITHTLTTTRTRTITTPTRTSCQTGMGRFSTPKRSRATRTRL